MVLSMRRVQQWLGITVLWLLWGLFQSSRLRLEVPNIDWPKALRFGMPDAAIWALLTPFVVFMGRRFAISATNYVRRVGFHVLCAVTLAVLHAALDTALNIGAGRNPSTAWPLFQHLISHGMHWNIVIYLAIVGVVHVRDAERRTMELRARLSEARLDALRMQLRPHFLFNTLHTVSGLMGNDAVRGRRVISRLGDLLRAALRPREREEIALSEELDLVRAYLDIEQARFGERLQVDMEVEDDALSCTVPALVMQPLVENAVRHGVEPRAEGGVVTLRARVRGDQLEITLTDNGPGMKQAPQDIHRAESGIGLSNTRARLRELYPDRHEFDISAPVAGGTQVKVVIPAQRPARPLKTRMA